MCPPTKFCWTKNIARVALCLAAALFSSSAYAAVVSITGSPLAGGPDPFYGSALQQNNVVNSPGVPATNSVLFDPSGPNLTSATPWIQSGQVSALTCGSCTTTVQWFLTGAESGFGITFHASGITDFTEGNQNNSVYSGGPPLNFLGQVEFLGTTTLQGTGLIPLEFSLSWESGTVDNSAPQVTPGSGVASLIFSYADISMFETNGRVALTRTPGDWFAFALNDGGGRDVDHDDFVGFALVTVVAVSNFPTPIPGALTLFGSAVATGLWLQSRRRRSDTRCSGSSFEVR